jgi:phage terminase small subunit
MKAAKHLKPATRKWFAEVADRFDLEPHQFRLLQAAGEAWDRLCAARAAIDEHGLTYSDRYGNPRPRPEISIERDARIGFARLLRELGIDDAETPVAPGMAPKRANDRNWRSGHGA